MKPIRIFMMVFFFLYAVNIYIYRVLAVNNTIKFTMRPWRSIIFIWLPLPWVCMMQTQGKVYVCGGLESLNNQAGN